MLLDFVVVDRRLSPNLFFLLVDVFLFFNSPKYRRVGFRSRFGVCKVFCNCSNPSVQLRCAVDFCVEFGLLVYRADGLLYWDFDVFEDFFRGSARGLKVIGVVDALSTVRF